MEQTPIREGRPAESEADITAIFRAVLQAAATNTTQAVGGRVCNEVSAATGFDTASVRTIMGFASEAGMVMHCFAGEQKGFVLTGEGRYVWEHLDEIIADAESGEPQ